MMLSASPHILPALLIGLSTCYGADFLNSSIKVYSGANRSKDGIEDHRQLAPNFSFRGSSSFKPDRLGKGWSDEGYNTWLRRQSFWADLPNVGPMGQGWYRQRKAHAEKWKAWTTSGSSAWRANPSALVKTNSDSLSSAASDTMCGVSSSTSSSLVDIANSTYVGNAEWIRFTGSNLAIWEALSYYVSCASASTLCTTDIRTLYSAYGGDAQTMKNNLDGVTSCSILSCSGDQYGCCDTCVTDSTCFISTKQQMNIELTQLAAIRSWFDYYIAYHHDLQANMQTALTSIQSLMDLSEETYVPPPVEKSWTSTIIGAIAVMGDASILAGMATALVAPQFVGLSIAAISTSVGLVLDATGKATYGDVDITKDAVQDAADLKAAEVSTQLVIGLGQFANMSAWQLSQISSDWGKMQAMYTISQTCPLDTLSEIVWTNTEIVYGSQLWKAVGLLMPVKYKIAWQRNWGQHSPSCIYNRRRKSSDCKLPYSCELVYYMQEGENGIDYCDKQARRRRRKSQSYETNHCHGTRGIWVADISDHKTQSEDMLTGLATGPISLYINAYYGTSFAPDASGAVNLFGSSCIYAPSAITVQGANVGAYCNAYGVILTTKDEGDCKYSSGSEVDGNPWGNNCHVAEYADKYQWYWADGVWDQYQWKTYADYVPVKSDGIQCCIPPYWTGEIVDSGDPVIDCGSSDPLGYNSALCGGMCDYGLCEAV